MNRKFALISVVVAVFLLVTLLTPFATGQKRTRKDRDEREREEREEKKERDEKAKTPGDKQRKVDDPDDEEDLNRELWESAQKTPYSSILPYVTAAQRASLATQTNEVGLPTGWRIAPVGTQVEVGRLPYEAIEFAGRLVVLDTGYYNKNAKETQEVSIVDTGSGQVVDTLKPNSLFPSAQIGLDGDLYLSGGFDQKLFRYDHDFKLVREYPVGGFAGGLAALDANHLAVVYMATKTATGGYGAGKLAILNTQTGVVEREVRVGYFPYAVQQIKGHLYVTLLGEDKLLVYNVQLQLLKTLVVGRTPQAMCTDAQDLYVVNTSSDSLSVVNTRLNRITATISLAAKNTRFGAAPSSCAVDGNRLYVTLAGTNSLTVLDKRTHKQLALIPTAWYPTKVLVNDKQLVVVSAKGIHARHPNPKGPPGAGPSRAGDYVLTLLKGSVSIISKNELDANATAWTRIVNDSAPVFDPQQGFTLPIHHIFYIIKENRTYDQVLGDLPRGNGDRKLTLFGEAATPIHHQLANEFVTLDNFFCNGEISVLGHSFTTSGYASPFLEWFGNLTYGYRWKGYPYGMVPATTSPAYLWDILDEKKVDYRIYGENYYLFTRAYRIFKELYGPSGELSRKFYDKVIAAAAGDDRGVEFNALASPYYGQADTIADAYQLLGNAEFAHALSIFLTGDGSFARGMARDDRLRRRFAEYLYHYPFNFRSWDLKYSDLDRVREWKKDFATQLKLGQVAQLSYIWLPNDHTDGAATKILGPFQFIAQNDTAVGRVVEAVAQSPVWKDSLIFVVEDDAQNGPDHVDATRTVALAAGPYVKRGAVISDRYDQLSMLRTMEILLGLEPLNLTDRLAVPMFGIFTDKPDFKPFVPVAASTNLAPADRERDRLLGQP
jgi:YVTN family beta-propeller protein